MSVSAESFKQVMRRWPTGVGVVTGAYDGVIQGMTVNSFTSLSINPPTVSVSLAHIARTYQLVEQSRVFGLVILGEDQQALSDRFAGRTSTKDDDRFEGLALFTLESGVPFFKGGLAFLDCRVIHAYRMADSTLFVGEVAAALAEDEKSPLVYLNQQYRKLEK